MTSSAEATIHAIHAIHAITAPSLGLVLSDWGVLAIQGADARRFLQSQLSNDAQLITPQRGQLSGFCTPKGRLLAILHLVQIGPESFVALLPLEIAERVKKRLQMFVLRSKVAIQDLSSEWAVWGLVDPAPAAAPEFLRSALHNHGMLLQLPGAQQRFFWAGPQAHAPSLSPLALSAWQQAELEAGIPNVVQSSQELWVPQSVDLDLIQGVSFTKGCYPGQEIVARMHYLGRVKERLHHAACSQVASAGIAIYDASGDGQAVGAVVSAGPSTQGGYHLLLVLKLSHSASTTLHLGAIDGPAISDVTLAHPQ